MDLAKIPVSKRSRDFGHDGIPTPIEDVMTPVIEMPAEVYIDGELPSPPKYRIAISMIAASVIFAILSVISITR